MGRRWTIALGALALVLVAAAAFGAARGDDRTPDEQGSGAPRGDDVVDWEARTARLADDRWSVDFCEGDGPFVCFTGSDGSGGSIELSTWPARDLDVVAEVLARGGTRGAALDAFVADFLHTFEADRLEGCGPGVDVVPEGPTAAAVGGGAGVRYGFRVIRDGHPVEHVLGHAVIAGDALHLLTTSALADDACLAREGEFDMAAFDGHTIELVGRLAAASVLPAHQGGTS